MKYCENCGAQIEDDAVFCDECGEEQSHVETEIPKQKKTAAVKVIIIILCVLAAGAAGFCIYYFNFRDSRPKAATETAAEKEPQSLEDAAGQGENEDEIEVPEEAEEESEPEQLKFIGLLDQTYKIEDNTYPAEITISNQNGNTVDVNINISDGIYDLTYYGMITSGSIIQISLDGGERINLMWDNETTFRAAPADGFSDDSIRMMRMLCECLNNKTYSAVQEQKSVQAVQPPSGKYWQGDTPPAYADYYVEVSNVTSDGFDFVIYGLQGGEGNYDVVFMPHTAVYTDTYTAVYYGQQYTLTFNWQEIGYLTVEGFEEWIPSGSLPLYNNSYLGVS